MSAQIFKPVEDLTDAVGTQPSWCLSRISETYQTIDQKSGYEISTKKNCLSLSQPRKSLNFFKLSFYNCKTWVWSSLHHFNTVTVKVTNSPIYRTFLFWRIKFQLLTLRHTVHMLSTKRMRPKQGILSGQDQVANQNAGFTSSCPFCGFR